MLPVPRQPASQPASQHPCITRGLIEHYGPHHLIAPCTPQSSHRPRKPTPKPLKAFETPLVSSLILAASSELPTAQQATPPGPSQYVHSFAPPPLLQIGMILFNIGLTYGFTALGDQTGMTLPAAFMQLPYEPRCVWGRGPGSNRCRGAHSSVGIECSVLIWWHCMLAAAGSPATEPYCIQSH
jgi:hypothetical protein